MVRDRDNYITASIPTETYNEDGDLVVTGSTQINFWGKVMDNKDDKNDFDPLGGRRRNKVSILIEADSRDIADLTIDHYITYDNSTNRYQVVDIYDPSGRRFAKMIKAEYIN